jgi:hypothetical protein
MGDYVTKHHPPAHHRIMRPKYLLNVTHSIEHMRGCVNPVPAQSTPKGHSTELRHRFLEHSVPIHASDEVLPRSQNSDLIS